MISPEPGAPASPAKASIARTSSSPTTIAPESDRRRQGPLLGRLPGRLPEGGAGGAVKASRRNVVSAAAPNAVLAAFLAAVLAVAAAAVWPSVPAAAGDDEDVREDVEAVLRLFEAAERGDVEALYALGSAYLSEDLHDKSFEFFVKAAELGHAPSQMAVSTFYFKGAGRPADPAKSFEWMRRAAEGGLADAQFGLGLMHLEGFATPADAAKAVEWWRRAAAQGHEDAKAMLRDRGY